MRVKKPYVNRNNKVSLATLGVKMENQESKCMILGVKENPGSVFTVTVLSTATAFD